MNNLLNRGLNYSILPKKLDITQVLLDFERFKRKMIWKEFFHGQEQEQEYSEPIFKTKKNNMPKDHITPHGLTTFLNSIRSEIMDPKNRNEEKCNLPKEEIEALTDLINLQKDRKVVIKACDKGSGIIVLNFEDYLRSCYLHLTEEQEQSDGSSKPYYKLVNENEVVKSKIEIIRVLEDALKNKLISKNEFEAMNPENKDPARFYCTFKVHKPHAEGTPPPPRPIVSGNNSITANIGLYVEHHIKRITTQHSTYLQDTSDFLRNIDKLNEANKFKANTILASIDVTALYTNIPQKEGLESLSEALNERTDKTIPSEFLVKLMEIVLKNNFFSFHDGIYRQDIGGAMGSNPMPSYADNFMARKIDKKIEQEENLKFLKRFLDDLFLIFEGTTKELHQLLDRINQIHPAIQFTMEHTTVKSESPKEKCSCEPKDQIPFLDTSCGLKNGQIEVDLYRKKTNKNQYLLLSSCHPKSVTRNIPFSLGLRIVRICTSPKTRDMRLSELKMLLLQRGYNEMSIDRALEKAKKVPRKQALRKKKQKGQQKRPTFAVQFDPRMPSVTNVVSKHWRSMISQNQYLAEVFKEPPLTAFKKQRNIKDHLIRAKVADPPKMRPERKINGMFKCEKNCPLCPYIKEGKSITVNRKTSWKINK